MNTIDQLGTDIASEMLLALTTEERQEVQIYTPLSEMIQYLKKNVDCLSIADRRTIGEILIMNDMKSHLCSCSEGIIINLKNLNENVVRQMYDLMNYKIKKN